jgi:hypothetical protein
VPPVLIEIDVSSREPLAGSVRSVPRDDVPFVGWLELLRVLSELCEVPGGRQAGTGGEAELR